MHLVVNYKGYFKFTDELRAIKGETGEALDKGSVPVELGLPPSSHVEMFTNLEVLQTPCFRDLGEGMIGY